MSLISGVCGDGFVRVVAADTQACVQRALDIHRTSPVASAALGRLLTGAVLMSRMLKNERDSITLQVKSRGPLGGMVAIAGADGSVRGYCQHPAVDLPLRADGKLDVGGAVGKGTLSVIKDLGLKEPYGGTVALVSGEIAEDLSYYFASSEQVPSVVALGVLVAPDDGADCGYRIDAAGGYMLQLMPGAPETLIAELEQRVSGFLPVTTLLHAGASISEICEDLLRGLGLDIREEKACAYRCTCSRARMERALRSIGREALSEMIREDHGAEMVCHFCRERYNFTETDLQNLLESDPYSLL